MIGSVPERRWRSQPLSPKWSFGAEVSHVGPQDGNIEPDVAAAVVEDAVGCVLTSQELVERHARERDGLQDEERREDAVALGEEERNAEPSRLLAADADFAREHLLGDVLEADRRDVERDAEARGDAVEEERRRERLRDGAFDLPASREALGEERQDPVRRDERAVGREDAQPVAVAVAREDDVEAFLRERLARGAEVLADRLGVDPSEGRVPLAAKRRHARRVPFADDLL